MKLLTRMLLVNWHYYQREWVDFGKINFLTGKTGSGKSTLVDALQIVLLGDTNGGSFFNKAANDRSRRNLKGYLRGEYGDDGGSGFLYLRSKPFSTYLACEFEDTEKHTFISVGVVFDCNYTASDESLFFILRDRIPEDAFVEKGVALTREDLRKRMRKYKDKSRCDFCPTAREYQEKLRAHLGGLHPRFFTLLKKAVSFTPIVDIEEFITHHICDVRKPPDLSEMQGNLRQYRKLEQETETMQARIATLETIGRIHAKVQDERQSLQLYRFLIDRSEQERTERLHLQAIREAKELDGRVETIRLVQQVDMSELKRLRDEHERLIELRGQNDLYKREKELKDAIARLEREIGTLDRQVGELVGRLNRYGLQWGRAGSEAIAFLGKVNEAHSLPSNSDMENMNRDTQALETAATTLHREATALLDIRKETAGSWRTEQYQACQEASERFNQGKLLFSERLTGMCARADREVEDCEDRISDLRQNIKPLDRSVVRFREELRRHLSEKLVRPASVEVLADLLEILSTRWVNVIEGYLYKQKQYLLVEPDGFLEALRLYERYRMEWNLFDVSLIDGGKVLRDAPEALTGSLAEEIATQDPHARAYVNFMLGRVVKCERVEDLRRHERAVTDTGILYQGYVVSSIQPKLWERHLIGKKSIQQQLLKLEAELPVLKQNQAIFGGWSAAISGITAVEGLNRNETEIILAQVAEAGRIPSLRDKRDETVRELGGLDLAWVLDVSRQIADLFSMISKMEGAITNREGELGALRQRLDSLQQEKIPEAERIRAFSREQVERQFPVDWRNTLGEMRFQAELSAKGMPERVAADFKPQLGGRENSIEKLKNLLTNARSDYNREYRYSLDVTSADNAKFNAHLTQLQQEELPQYAEKISVAKEMAYEQFANQFLAEMKDSIENVRTRIDALNRALKAYRWGTERFLFQVTENPEYRRFYDMIADPLLLEGYTMMSALFLEKHKSAIDELFAKIADMGTAPDGDARTEMERNIRLFTDYKTYLRFDMVSIDENDNRQRLSRTLLKKSGGETQTPFYIAMLASFAQLYHINDRKYNMARIILFDEAFSKMDGERIRESIQMLREIGFQCILSAPPEKIGDIAPLVDRTIAVMRQGHWSFTQTFDANRLLSGEWLDAESEGGDDMETESEGGDDKKDDMDMSMNKDHDLEKVPE